MLGWASDEEALDLIDEEIYLYSYKTDGRTLKYLKTCISTRIPKLTDTS